MRFGHIQHDVQPLNPELYIRMSCYRSLADMVLMKRGSISFAHWCVMEISYRKIRIIIYLVKYFKNQNMFDCNITLDKMKELQGGSIHLKFLAIK